ncbi:MAG: aldose epimerase family protein [Chitinophagaceae bacterium]
MPINKELQLQHQDKDVFMFTLTNAKGTQLKITNYGAIVMALEITLHDGTSTDLILGLDTASDYISGPYRDLKANPFFGAFIGRFANRIAGGRFSIDGKEYQLAQNLSPEHLHGGNEGFDQKVWDLQYFIDSPYPQLGLQYISQDMEEGYPGNLVAQVRYGLTNDNEFIIEYGATTDSPTLFNPTNHCYFNLNGVNGSIADHVLMIPSPVILEQDEYSTPTGNLLEVEDTVYDFRIPKTVGRDWNPLNGYDQSFVVGQDFQSAAAEIYSPSSGVRMEVFSTAPVVHFYSGSGIENIKGKNGLVYEAFAGFSLETQIHPNGINISNFPDSVLRPGEQFTSRTMYRFTQDPAS